MTPPNFGKKITADVWGRWQWAMHFVFYGLLVLGLVSALLDGPPEGPYSLGFVALPGVLSLLLGGWYWFVLVRHHDNIEERPIWALAYFVVATPLFAGLVFVHPAFASLSFVFYWHNYSLLNFRPLPWLWPTLGATLLTLVIMWGSAGSAGVTRLFSLPQAAPTFLGILIVSAVLSAFIGSIISQSRRRQGLIEELEEARRELAVQERRAGVLEERGRLAREIHDTLAQGFTSIVAHLEASEAALPPNAGTSRRHLDFARETARDNLVEARHLVEALRPEILAGSSLPEALQRLTDRWSRESDVPAGFVITGERRALPQGHQVALLRAGQEALSNVRKHAGATGVTVTLSYMGDAVALDVQDDGSGFDGAPATADGGFGLHAMRERVEELGGRLLFESAPDEGATLVVELPVKASGHGHQKSRERRPDA